MTAFYGSAAGLASRGRTGYPGAVHDTPQPEVGVKKLVIVALVVAGVVLALRLYKGMDARAFESQSRERAEKVFNNLRSGRSSDEEYAIKAWLTGGTTLPISAKDQDDFMRFLEKKGLSRTISSFELLSSEVKRADDVNARHAEVRVRVNDRPLTLIVRYKQPIEWGS
jgi:hypothetical protein